MSCRSKPQITRKYHRVSRAAFTLIESMVAVALLAFIGASVWLVLERCTASAADSIQRMRAFEIAHENMEKLLGSDSVQEMTEYGISEKFPDIRWQTIVESFSEPIASRMWVRAVCSAEYTNTAGETRSVELTHWLTDLTDEQVQQLTQRNELLKQALTKYIIETEELAAQYAGVNVETIRQWVKNGMPTTPEGACLKPWLDLYLQTDGKPTEQDKQNTLSEYPVLSSTGPKKTTPDQLTEPGSETAPSPDSHGPYTTLPEDADRELRETVKRLLGS